MLKIIFAQNKITRSQNGVHSLQDNYEMNLDLNDLVYLNAQGWLRSSKWIIEAGYLGDLLEQ